MFIFALIIIPSVSGPFKQKYFSIEDKIKAYDLLQKRYFDEKNFKIVQTNSNIIKKNVNVITTKKIRVYKLNKSSKKLYLENKKIRERE